MDNIVSATEYVMLVADSDNHHIMLITKKSLKMLKV